MEHLINDGSFYIAIVGVVFAFGVTYSQIIRNSYDLKQVKKDIEIIKVHLRILSNGTQHE